MAAVPPFNFATRLGLVFISEFAALSAGAVIFLLIYIGYSAARVKRGSSRRWSTVTQVHWYLLSLLLSDLIQAVGGLMDIKWVAEAGVTTGPYCTGQGILKNMGDVGVALASLAIGVHTFLVLAFRHRFENSAWVAPVVLSCIWLFVALNIGISIGTHQHEDYYDDTQYWCWISSRFPTQRIMLEYLWLWLSGFTNAILYILLFFIIKGVVAVDGWKLRFIKPDEMTAPGPHMNQAARHANSIALKMLYYPAIYIFTILPITIARFKEFTGGNVPFAATAFADAVFASSGLLNVLLFWITRPSLMPARDHNTSAGGPAMSWSLNSVHTTAEQLVPDANVRLPDEDGDDHWTIGRRSTIQTKMNTLRS